jgi:hypothetical protein
MDAQPAIVEVGGSADGGTPQFGSVAATDNYARSDQERELCDKASRPDWLYLAIPPVLTAGALVLDSIVVKYDPNEPVRDIGPLLVGLTWGTFIGSFWPSMPKCSPHYVTTAPPEGDVHASWPVAFAFALLAAATAPVVDYIAIGPVPDAWSNAERVTRIVLAGTVAFGAAFIPYLIPPKTVWAARQLQHLRANISAQSSFVSYTLQF